MKKIFVLLLTISCLCVLFSQEGNRSKTEQARLDTLNYGTENEVIELIKTLKSENDESMNEDLINLLNDTKNTTILIEVFTFFGGNEKSGLEERALELIENRDDEASQSVTAAINYLGNVKSSDAVDLLIDVIDSDEERYLGAAFQALGKSGGTNRRKAADTAEYLIDYYENNETTDNNRSEIIAALGELGVSTSLDFLIEMAENDNESVSRRMAAVKSLSKIGDSDGLDAIINCVSSSDPNLRSTAVSALGPFSGRDAENAIIEAFRDSFWRTRLAAAEASSERKLKAAIPFLKFRAEKDEIPQVKDEAIKALGSIGTDECFDILSTFFFDRKNSDRVRIATGEVIISQRADDYTEKFIVELDEAKTKNLTVLYNGLSKIIATAETSKVSDLASRFLASGGVVERSYAMDMILKNGFSTLADQIQPFVDEKKYGSLARKARSTLEKMGIPVKEPETTENQTK
ncbi:MAG: HEAT repeat domain-containing protein [Treponema sp.]|jgi:HEAT repeat protein|nr:HEAT repeat domain-containing protein [Treponema sp.]